MKTIIYTFSQYISFDMGVELIPMGIEGLETNSRDEALVLLKEDASIPLLITDNFQSDFMNQVKTIRPDINIFLIISQNVKPNDLKELMNIGIKSLVHYSENPAIMADEIVKNIINQNIKTHERRSQIRIKPKIHEKDYRRSLY